MWDEYEGYYTVDLDRYRKKRVLAKGHEMFSVL